MSGVGLLGDAHLAEDAGDSMEVEGYGATVRGHCHHVHHTLCVEIGFVDLEWSDGHVWKFGISALD